MTLITLLIALALEHTLGNPDRLRPQTWFTRYGAALETHYADAPWWNGPRGVLLTLAPPLLALLLAALLLDYLNFLLPHLLALAVLFYSLGPSVNSLLNRYLRAVADEDAAAKAELEAQILALSPAEPAADAAADAAATAFTPPAPRTTQATHAELLEGLLLRAHERLFGVIFWFIVLGALGAALFCMTARLLDQYRAIHGGYADAARHLYRILSWPSARLLAVSFALAGSLADGLQGWLGARGETLEIGEDIVRRSGLGALQYNSERRPRESRSDSGTEAGDGQEQDASGDEWLSETRALLRRALVIWLGVLGFVTIPGWLG